MGRPSPLLSVFFLPTPILVFFSHLPPTERTPMTVTTPTVPDEETPLLGDQRTSATEPGSGAATLAGPSNQGSPTPSVKGKADVNRGSGVVKKTPLPWAQFSIVLFLQLAERLTSQVIYPVSCSAGFFFLFAVARHVPMGFHQTLNDTFVVCTGSQFERRHPFVEPTS